MLRRLAPRPSPTLGLFLGLIITLAAVVAYSWYITRQISGLREMQNNLVARNRKDSLQLLAFKMTSIRSDWQCATCLIAVTPIR